MSKLTPPSPQRAEDRFKFFMKHRHLYSPLKLNQEIHRFAMTKNGAVIIKKMQEDMKKLQDNTPQESEIQDLDSFQPNILTRIFNKIRGKK